MENSTDDAEQGHRDLLDILWPWLTLVPLLAFSCALLLLFGTTPGQIIESLKIGSGSGYSLPIVTLVPMMVVMVAHGVFLMHVQPTMYFTTAHLISCIPWGILLYFWVRLDDGTVLWALVYFFLPIAGVLKLLEISDKNRSRAFHISLAAVGLLLIIHMVLTSLMPIAFPRFLGAVPVIVTGIGILSTILFAFFIFARASWWVFAGLGAILFIFNPSHDIRSVPPGETGPEPISEAFVKWLEARPDLEAYRAANKPYPVIITSAEGGGITAAGHAFFTLMGLQDNCPMFAQHVFASVGVSGGSFGNALFGAKLQDLQPQAEVLPCRPSTNSLAADGIEEDHFAPVVASFLFSDVPNAILPFVEPFGPTRAEALELSFEELDTTEQAFMRRPVESSWTPEAVTPAMVFVSTQVSTGDRFQMSPLYESSGWFLPFDTSIRVSSAVGASARFPWITPSAALVEGETRRNLVDGGYFENSGADAAMELVRKIWNADNENDGGVWSLQNGCRILPQRFFTNAVDWGCDIPIHVTYLAITDVDTRHPAFAATSEKQSFLADPITTMLSTRTARGSLALSNARLAFCQRLDCEKGAGVNSGFQDVSLPSVKLGLPLGWSLSLSSVEKLREFSVSLDTCAALRREYDPTVPNEDLVRLDRTDPLVAKNYNGCHLATLASLFDLGTFDGIYHGIQGYGYEFQ